MNAANNLSPPNSHDRNCFEHPVGQATSSSRAPASTVTPAIATALLAMNSLAASRGEVTTSDSWTDVQTVMLKNLPIKLTQEGLLAELDSSGFTNMYDFLYLPIDDKTRLNKGYAFINFMKPSIAMLFRKNFEGNKFRNFNSTKVLSTSPAALQGFEANYAHYANARVKHREPSARPLFLRNQQRDSRRNNNSAASIDATTQRLRQHTEQTVGNIMEELSRTLQPSSGGNAGARLGNTKAPP